MNDHLLLRISLVLLLAVPGRWGHTASQPAEDVDGDLAEVDLRTAEGPVKFGYVELSAALDERGLSVEPFPFGASIVAGVPESFTVRKGRITGGDERGLMYGLLEAAGQIRRSGRVRKTDGEPAAPMRGIRLFVNNEDLERSWYYSDEFWEDYLGMLARNRFNRFSLVFANQTAYLSPPYPFWVDLPDFPEVRAVGLTAEQRARNLETLRFISKATQAHGIDFTLGVWAHDHPVGLHGGLKPMVEGLTQENLIPYSYAALRKVLKACPAIRSVQVRTGGESGIRGNRQVEFYRDAVFRAIQDAGRPVILDLRPWQMRPGMFEAAKASGIPVRMSGKYFGEQIGRPYQPGETWPRHSYENYLERPNGRSRSYDLYWELWSGSHRLLMWGSPEQVRRMVPSFTLSGTIGFEIDAALAMKGMGNKPGTWAVFTPQQLDRVFWRREYERYWPWFLLWGRGSYDPESLEELWTAELERRFGDAAPAVGKAYTLASQVMHEILTTHLLDPNVNFWPEINPGGILDAYRESSPMDWRTVASMDEAVRNRLNGTPSAKQTPLETSKRLRRLAIEIEAAVQHARNEVHPANSEWRSTEIDFLVLSHLARFHSHRLIAAYQLTLFYEACVRSALDEARAEAERALGIWEELVRLTDGVYPDEMAFHWQEYGHWKDKLPYLRHDLKTLAERRDICDRFGRFDHGFDFGGPTAKPRGLPFRCLPSLIANTVEPRFLHVDANTRYTAERGYGWASDGARKAHDIPLTHPDEIRSAVADPQGLPSNVLFGDSIEGSGRQVFRLHVADGDYTATLLLPDRQSINLALTANDGRLDISLPNGVWNISGLVVKSTAPPKAITLPPKPGSQPRPTMTHRVIARAAAGRPLTLRLQVFPARDVRSVRLYYRPLNHHADYVMLEQTGPEAEFTIPGEQISANWDLMYYFEILNGEKSGWFYPDPRQATPYFVVPVKNTAGP